MGKPEIFYLKILVSYKAINQIYKLKFYIGLEASIEIYQPCHSEHREESVNLITTLQILRDAQNDRQFSHTLYAAGEEREDQRSAVG